MNRKPKHQPKPKPQNQPQKPSFWGDGTAPIAIAHRGGDGAGGKKRNTLEAFQSAYDAGYSYVETDIITAASGELVAIHGSYNWLQAAIQTDITRSNLQRMTLSQIRQVLKPGGAEIPTLEEVINSFPTMKFVIDLKTNETIEPLAKLIKRLGMHDRVCATGLDYNRNRSVAEACGSKKLSIGVTINRGLRLTNMNLLLLKSGRLSGAEAVFMHHSLISTPMVNLVHYRGLKAVVWTANSSLSIKHAIRCGVDGIISDRIHLLKEAITSNTKPL